MKRCPYCAEEIQDEAVKCRFCGEYLEPSAKPKTARWYHSTAVIVLAIFTVGPFALPLVWFHPRYNVAAKAVVTVVVVGLTFWTAVGLMKELAYLKDLMEQLDQISHRRH
jgi:lipopolysaccharide export LptBFGC system permease protein LptF